MLNESEYNKILELVKEMQKSIEYMVLVKEYKDATNNLIKLFSDKDNSKSTIREISQEILGIGFSIGKLI